MRSVRLQALRLAVIVKAPPMSSFSTPADSGVAALIRARQNIEADPDSVKAHFDHALALCQLAQWEPAVAAWQNVVRLDPDNAFAYINMGVVHLEQAQWPQAEHAFEQAVRCQPDRAAAQYGLGVVRAQQGRLEGPDGARSAWEQTLLLAPDHVQARESLAELNAMAQAEPLPPVECVVTSQIHLQPPLAQEAEAVVRKAAPNDPPGALNTVAALSEHTAATPARQRIKIPPAVGPSLASIADAVIAAQHSARPDAGATVAANSEGGRDGITPTLRLNAADLKAGHRNLRAPAALSRPQQFLSSLPGRALLGAGTVSLLVVMALAWQKEHRSPTPSVPNAFVTPAVLPVTSSASPENAGLPAPASVAAPSVIPPAPRPDIADVPPSKSAENASVLSQNTVQSKQVDVVNSNSHEDTPAPRPQPRAAHNRHTQTLDTDAMEPSHSAIVHRERAHTTRVGAANSDEITGSRTRAIPRSLPKPAAARHRSHSGEEDTFGGSAAPSRSTPSSDEWTDRPPQ